jgi:hypothetical protein
VAFCEAGGFGCREKGAWDCKLFADKTGVLGSSSLQMAAEEETAGLEREIAGFMSQSRGWEGCRRAAATTPSTDDSGALVAFSMAVEQSGRSGETGGGAVE